MSIVGRAITMEKEIKKLYNENEAIKTKSDNFTRSYREQSNIVIAIL